MKKIQLGEPFEKSMAQLRGVVNNSRWWQLKSCLFSPLFSEDFQFD